MQSGKTLAIYWFTSNLSLLKDFVLRKTCGNTLIRSFSFITQFWFQNQRISNRPAVTFGFIFPEKNSIKSLDLIKFFSTDKTTKRSLCTQSIFDGWQSSGIKVERIPICSGIVLKHVRLACMHNLI
jgi:hypothetical protein